MKRIYEQDDIPVKHMVLAIADIISSDPMPAPPTGARDLSKFCHELSSWKSFVFLVAHPVYPLDKSHVRLVLTDGWYEIPTCIDHRMERAIARGKIRIGSKLSICGAQVSVFHQKIDMGEELIR